MGKVSMNLRPIHLGLTCVLLTIDCMAQMPDPPGQVQHGETPKNEAYLFAHMMQGDYWRLYYSVSLDGLHWVMLNGGKRVCAFPMTRAQKQIIIDVSTAAGFNWPVHGWFMLIGKRALLVDGFCGYH